MTADVATSHHHESADVVAGRQLLGVWLFIAGDAIILVSLLFTYLYLRGLNTLHQWMPKGVHGASTLSAWLIVAVVAASAWATWSSDQATRAGRSAIPGALLAGLLALAGVVLSAVAISDLPHRIAASTGARVVAGSYASSLLAIDVSNLVHLALLIFLGLAVVARSRKGLISQSSPTHVRLVRIFWVWVAFSVALAAIVTTVFVASPK